MVGQRGAALQTLHDVITSKRHRTWHKVRDLELSFDAMKDECTIAYVVMGTSSSIICRAAPDRPLCCCRSWSRLCSGTLISVWS